MLSHLARGLTRSSIFKISYNLSISKTILEKKKRAYETRILESDEVISAASSIGMGLKLDQQQKFQTLLIGMGTQIRTLFMSHVTSGNPDHNKILSDKLEQIIQKYESLLLESKVLGTSELINYVQVIKSICLNGPDQKDFLIPVYKRLEKFALLPRPSKILQKLSSTLWQETTKRQTLIRAITLVKYFDAKARDEYFRKIVPYVRWFKSSEILTILHEKQLFNYPLSYQFLDQLHRNQHFQLIESIGQAHFKRLFVERIKGEFSPQNDGIFSKVLMVINDKPNILEHSTFSELISMLHSQNYFVQTQSSRVLLEQCLNSFINIAKNQNYDLNNYNIEKLVEIYLGFEESQSNGEVLLREITYFSKINNLMIQEKNIEIFKKVMRSVLRNIQIKLKYECLDYLNKEFTNETISFMKEFIPKLLPLWPELIFELNNASFELFKAKNDPLLHQIASIFNQKYKSKPNPLTLEQISQAEKIISFIICYQKFGLIQLKDEQYLSFLKEYSNKPANTKLQNNELEVLYHLLFVLDDKIANNNFKNILTPIYMNLILPHIKQQMSIKSQSVVCSMDDSVKWLGLCSSILFRYKYRIDHNFFQDFMNKKLVYLLRSLKYLQVYSMVHLVMNLKNIRNEVYEQISAALSTFLIYLSDKRLDTYGGSSPYYINHKYSEYYAQICRLIIDNYKVFISVEDKNAFRVFQLLLYKSYKKISNRDLLKVMVMLENPNNMTYSMLSVLQKSKFTKSQLKQFEQYMNLSNYDYYNESLATYFQRSYNQSDIISRLKGDLSLSSRTQIQQIFANYETYKTVFLDGDLNIYFQIPQPLTLDVEIKYMYICQVIYQKLSMFNNFQLRGQRRSPQTELSADLTSQRRYIQRHNLVQQYNDGDLRINSRTLPKYAKLEVWKSYTFTDKDYQVDLRDLQMNQRLTKDILQNILKGFIRYTKHHFRDIINRYSIRDDIVNKFKQAGLKFIRSGCSLTFHKKSQDSNSVLLFANNANYKILYICAAFLASSQESFFIIKDQNIDTIVSIVSMEYRVRKGEKEDAQDQQ